MEPTATRPSSDLMRETLALIQVLGLVVGGRLIDPPRPAQQPDLWNDPRVARARIWVALIVAIFGAFALAILREIL
jgi:hypothetical protein